ncbi:hypothetical protein ABIB40_002360 [Pedobacter sp. UYP30]|uniref:hypothetical protein n=1 Tax=Pedobacter sp. UYP30 TaxID=1756400 RepID=UPI0033910AE2
MQQKLRFFKLTLGLVLLAAISFGQQVVKGVVMEKGSNLRIALADITNLRTKLGVGSNDLGLFQLKAEVGDTLLVSKRDHADVRVAVTGAADLVVYLLRSSTQLKDVNVFGDTKEQDLAEVKSEYKRKGSFYGGKPPFLSFLFSPLTAVYELFGKTPRNARRFSRYADNEIKQSEIDRYFNQSIIKNNSCLRGDTLETYMLNCRPSYNQVEHWNSYDYIKYIKESTKKFTDTLGKGN